MAPLQEAIMMLMEGRWINGEIQDDSLILMNESSGLQIKVNRFRLTNEEPENVDNSVYPYFRLEHYGMDNDWVDVSYWEVDQGEAN